MSTATAELNITHLPHTAHPLPLREQAFALHCQGLRSPAIAAESGVPERTIRAWIAAALAELKDDLQLNRKEQLLLAVERQHQLTATAWQQFHHEAAARDALLDAALDTLVSNANDPRTSANTSPRALHLHLPASTPAPRYLSLILQANKEINRLLGLHTLAHLHLLAPDVPDAPDIAASPISNSDTAAESASVPADFHIPAESATGIPTPAAEAVAIALGASTGGPQCPEERFPAESATAAGPGLASGVQPANLHPTIPSPSLASARPAAPLSPWERGWGERSQLPAETATASASSHLRFDTARMCGLSSTP